MTIRTITGTIEYADGAIPQNSRAEFYLNGVHIDAVTIAHSAVYVPLDETGDITVDLYPNDVGYGADRYNVDLVTYSDSEYFREIRRVNLGKIFVEDKDAQVLQDLLALFSGPAGELSVAEQAALLAINAASDALQSAEDAANSAETFGVISDQVDASLSKVSRKSLNLIVHSDGQPRINDTVMPAGHENDQWGIYMNVLDDMGRAFGGQSSGMLHCGDVAWRAAMSASSIASAITALGDMAPADPGADLLIGVDDAIPGDEYPWGIAPILDAIEGRVGISRARVFAASGNHDTSGGGNGTNPIAYTMATFEKYFGQTAYHIIEGNVGFYILGTENAYDGGGQIAASTIEQARRVIRSHQHVKHWAFVIHQPPAGRHPREVASPSAAWLSTVTISAPQASSWGSGGEPLIAVGNYAGIRTNRTNLFLVHPHLGRVLLKQGRDYDYDTINTTGIPATPYNQVKILQTWAHGTITASTVIQLHTVWSLNSVQDGPTTFMLEDLFAEVQPFAVFHGHIGGSDDDTGDETNGGIRAVADWGGAYLVNMNMSLPARARLGIDPTTNPLISGFLEFNAETDTARFRYWNHTATIHPTTGVYTGDWMSVTHPLLTTEFTVDFSAKGGLDLGNPGSTIDGRRSAGREAQLNFLAMERDISEAPSRSEPLRDGAGALITTVEEGVTTPTYSTSAAGRVKFGDFGVTDRTLKEINPGDGGYFSFGLPRGEDSSTAGGSQWRDDQPSREAIRWFWETTSASDENPVPAMGYDMLNAAGAWQEVLRMAPGQVTIGGKLAADDLLSGVYTPNLTAVANVASSSTTTAAYYRVGNTVTVYGRVSIAATAANTDTQLRVSLPIAADITVTHAIGGTGAATTAGVMGQSVGINGDPATDTAVFNLRPTSTASTAYAYQFSYRVA